MECVRLRFSTQSVPPVGRRAPASYCMGLTEGKQASLPTRCGPDCELARAVVAIVQCEQAVCRGSQKIDCHGTARQQEHLQHRDCSQEEHCRLRVLEKHVCQVADLGGGSRSDILRCDTCGALDEWQRQGSFFRIWLAV